MGLLFKRNLGGKNISFKKRVADSAISNNYIRETVKKSRSKFALGKSGAAKRTERDIIKAQAGGLELKETHEIIQKRIAAGDITKEKAKKLATEWGLTEERFQKFKNISEYKDLQKKQERRERTKKEFQDAQKSKLAIRQSNRPRESSPKISLLDSEMKIISQRKIAGTEAKNSKEAAAPKNIWESINKQKRFGASPRNIQKAT